MTQIINEGFKLSPQQRHLWSLQKGCLAYQAQCAIHIIGNLNTLSLQLALQNVIKKYEILRTQFHHQLGFKVPLQFVTRYCNASWRNIDLSNLDSREQEAKIEAIFLEERQRDTDVIVRACLLTLAAQNYILLLGIPAMNADTKTLNNLVSEISQAYAACLSGEDLSNAEDEVLQYLQFSEWQNQLLEDKDELAGREYWSNQDFSALATLVAPYENKSNAVRDRYACQSLEYAIASHIVNRVFALSQQYNISIDVILLACWQVLIWRLTSQKELIIGTAFDGRQYEELANSLGLFVKYLPIKSQIESQYRFIEFLEQVQNSIITAAEWQDYFSYPEIGQVTYPIGFEFAELPTKSVVADVAFELYRHYVCLEKFKIKLSCYQQDDRIFTNFSYDINCYEAEQIKYLAEQFLTLLENIIQHPHIAASRLNILSDRQQQQVLVEFNKTTNSNFPQDLCHQLFTEQAAKTPDNIAVVFEDEQLSYRELNNRVNQLANYLQQLGVKPDVLVGVCLERSHLSIVAILAILKAGGAYLPLDPTIPSDRLGLILQDSQVQVLLTQEKLLSSLPAHTELVVCLDRRDAIAFSCENPVSSVTCENLAYVIYTSGSTGKPKGVAVEHRQLCNYLNGILEKLDLPDAASFATVSTFAADLGNTVIFSALCTGRCLHIISHERTTNPVALAEYCRRHPIDCLKIVPSHLNALLTAANPEDILPSQLLILGGEAASWELVAQIQQLKPSCQILNHYGPTEATVGVLTYKVEPQVMPIAGCANVQSATVPIGRPIANTQVYLLDEHLQPVPLSVPGELYIGGANLARGYFNR
ncbi:MAG TPA: non-ribosomal peptide synthetase, partial [Cyanobacteria bacterium UBA11049]|nr:non-ribosomal peptide synthetase [Cyanobacteria bacterium UBA11049]